MPEFVHRREAGFILKNMYRLGGSRMLARAAVSGDGPPYHRAGRAAIYNLDELHEWAKTRLGQSKPSAMQHQSTRSS